jgi:2-polyprenyl-6-methoxyphenol hydroxylase-like FAD-dependent oxidoreductase
MPPTMPPSSIPFGNVPFSAAPLSTGRSDSTATSHGPVSATFDVIVVGARAAGAATAMLLARHGLRVLVVDRSRHGADTLSTHAILRAGVLQLHRWGLLDDVIAAGTPPVRRTTFIYDDDRIGISIKPSGGIDALYAPRRTVLDPILVDAAIAAGAHVRYGITMTDLIRNHDGHVSGIIGRDLDGRRVSFAAKLVIGADGVRSTVAARAGAPMERVGTGVSGVTYGYWSGVESDGYEWMFRPDACAGVIPTNDDQVCVFASATPATIGSGGVSVIYDVLEAAAPDVAARVRAGVAPPGTRSHSGRPGFVRRSFGPGWALVGDAGYWKDPIGAHGLSAALRDAELLARAVIATDDDHAQRDDALADYQATRDRLSSDLFGVVDVIAGYRWTADEIPGLLLQLSAAMADEVEALTALDEVPVP